MTVRFGATTFTFHNREEYTPHQIEGELDAELFQSQTNPIPEDAVEFRQRRNALDVVVREERLSDLQLRRVFTAILQKTFSRQGNSIPYTCVPLRLVDGRQSELNDTAHPDGLLRAPQQAQRVTNMVERISRALRTSHGLSPEQPVCGLPQGVATEPINDPSRLRPSARFLRNLASTINDAATHNLQRLNQMLAASDSRDLRNTKPKYQDEAEPQNPIARAINWLQRMRALNSPEMLRVAYQQGKSGC